MARTIRGEPMKRDRKAGMVKRSLPLSKVYRLLEPGPVVLVTTAGKGKANIMAQSWHMMIEFEPPLVGCVISNRNHSFSLLKAAKECVLNIPTVELAAQVVGCGNTSGRRTDKFKKFGLTPVAASRVKVPLIDECYASLECRVVDMRLQPNTTSSSSKSSRPGSIPPRKIPGRSTIAGRAPSWWQAERSPCPPR